MVRTGEDWATPPRFGKGHNGGYGGGVDGGGGDDGGDGGGGGASFGLGGPAGVVPPTAGVYTEVSEVAEEMRHLVRQAQDISAA